MDVARTSFILTIAALTAGTALAAPQPSSTPVPHTANFAGPGDWSSAGPTTVPTISANPNERYGGPQSPQTVVNSAGQQVQSWTNSASQGLQSASNTVRTTTQQTFGTAGYPAQSNNPFATPSTTPAATTAPRSNPAPPPWTTGTTTQAPQAAPSWTSNPVQATPVDRSLLTNPPAADPNAGWSSIGSTIAAPPLIVPTLPTATNSFTPLNNTTSTTPFNTASTSAFDNGPKLTTDSYPGNQPGFNAPLNSNSQSSTTARSGFNNDDPAAAWDTNANSNSASIGRSANNTSSRPNTSREPEFPATRVGSSTSDVRSTVAKPNDAWLDDSWTRNSQSPQNGAAASIGGSRNGNIGSAMNNAAPSIQAPGSNQQYGPPPFGTSATNTNFGGQNPNFPQQAGTANTAKPTIAGEPQQWVSLLVAIMVLAGSLAANIYLGWSYMDSRQKYQASVRRTADTFRRTQHSLAA